jgi:hypothetical protein
VRWRRLTPEILARGGNSGVHLRRKFWPGGRNSGPSEIFILKILARNSGPLLRVAPQLERKDLAKICRAGNSRISDPQKFWLLRIFGPFLQAAPKPFIRELTEFLRARNYGISGPRKFCQIRIFSSFTKHCTTTFCKGFSQISKGRKFV